MSSLSLSQIIFPRFGLAHGLVLLLLSLAVNAQVREALSAEKQPAASALPLASEPKNERKHVFRSITSVDGLVQNTINSLQQDSRGFVWIATQGGLHRYDGYRFVVYQHDPTDPDSLPDSLITGIVEHSSGGMWVGTDGAGVVLIDPDTGQVLRRVSLGEESRVTALLYVRGVGLWIGTRMGLYLLGEREGEMLSQVSLRYRTDQAGDALTSLANDAEGKLWFSLRRSGVVSLSRGQFKRFSESNTLGEISAIRFDLADRLLVASQSGLHEISNARLNVRRWEQSPKNISDLAISSDGSVWLATADSGLMHFDFAGNLLDHFKVNRELPGALADNTLNKIMIDRASQLWIGTRSQGLALTQTAPAPFSLLRPAAPDLDNAESYNVRALCTQDNVRGSAKPMPGGRLYFGTTLGTLQSRDQGGLLDWSAQLKAAIGTALPGMRVNALACSASGVVFIATSVGVWALEEIGEREARFSELEISGHPKLHVRSLLLTRDGSLYLGTNENGILRLDSTRQIVGAFTVEAGQLPSNMVLTMHEDRAGRIWAGTLEGIAIRSIQSLADSWVVVRSDLDDPRSLPGNLVRDFMETQTGIMWVATHSGLARVDSVADKDVRFSRFTVRDGLPSPTVYALQEDRLGRIWLSGNRGLVSFDPARLVWRSYELQDGLQELEFNGGATASFADGRIAFAGVGGINIFRPELIQPSEFLAPVRLISARAGPVGKSFPPSSGYQFEFDDRVFSFEFASLDLRSPARNGYAYKLEGFDRNWITGRGLGRASYTNLPEGTYRLRVRGSNRDDFWNPTELQVALLIKPPLLRTKLAYFSYAVGSAALLALGFWLFRRARARELEFFQALSEREDRLRLSLWGSQDIYWDYDVVGRHMRRNSTKFALGDGLDGEYSAKDYLSEQVHPDDAPDLRNGIAAMVQNTETELSCEHRLRNAAGNWAWVIARGQIVSRDASGKPTRLAGTARNIETERAAELQLAISQRVIERMSEAVAISDDAGVIVKVNAAFEQMTGYQQSEVVGSNIQILQSPRHDQNQYQAVQEFVLRDSRWKGEMWQRRRDGADILVSIELNRIAEKGGDSPIRVLVMSDITDRKRAEEELRFLANFDALTGLPNRTMLLQRLGRAISRAKRHKQRLALLFLDLDRFKQINDSLGHAAGDALLQAVAMRMGQAVREVDTVARLAGDEFVLLVEELDALEDADRAAARVLERFAEPFNLGNTDVVVSPSIGVAVFPDHSEHPDELLKCADLAMYAAKSAGRNTIRSYLAEQSHAAKERAATENLLRRALDRDQFKLYYQLAIDLKTLKPVGVEALLRWQHPTRGLVSPDVFIPILEENGMIVSVGSWVLDQAMAQLRIWDDSGLPGLNVAVNLSLLQLSRGDLFSEIPALLQQHHLSGERLTLELTESLVMANPEQSIETLNQLSSLGLQIAVDDFGTGYSSLAYLKRLPIDKLKIDKTFVRDLGVDAEDTAITHSIIALAQALGLTVIAEGVENETQQSLLRALGCQEAQGFLYSQPLSAAECTLKLQEKLHVS